VTVTADDLGVLSDLATALGIMRDGSPDPGWLGDPAARLGTVLADDAQRQALVSFLDEVLDDGSVAAALVDAEVRPHGVGMRPAEPREADVHADLLVGGRGEDERGERNDANQRAWIWGHDSSDGLP